MKYRDTILHLRGESLFTDDLPLPEGTLFAVPFCSPIARGKIGSLDLAAAERSPGVVAILTAADIPGENQIGNIIPDEPLLSTGELHYLGQPIALVLAESVGDARRAVSRIALSCIEEEPLLDPREAFQRHSLIAPPRTFLLGDPDKAWKECSYIIEGRVDSGGQEHLYMETQNSFAAVTEHGGVRIVSSTQSPTAVQRTTARILKLPMHMVEVDTPRLGGAFGGKEDQATCWAALAALGALHLRRTVRLLLQRQDDIRLTGKRHPYSSDFRIGLSRDLRILAYEVKFFQNAGAAADLSTAILERSLFHATNCYFIPNVRATGYSCRTNLPPFTAFRGFGAPQAMLVMEGAICKAAEKIGTDPALIQERNLLAKGDSFPYGMVNRSSNGQSCWRQLHASSRVSSVFAEIERFNSESRFTKRGAALMPLCFGISFTSTFMNQASALVHVYTDGSVGISTAAVEMGQGVNSKLAQIAARRLGIDPGRVKIETTNTTRSANTSPTAASTGADLNGNAVLIACEKILERLKRFAARELQLPGGTALKISNGRLYAQERELELDWNSLVQRAYLSRLSLSAQAHYATPEIFFNRETNKGDAFAYHVFGAALVTATLDCRRGIYSFDRVWIVHDGGRPLDPLIDRGQVEGALVQGLGWIAMEELLYNEKGRLLTDSLSGYKVPDIHFAPGELELEFLEPGRNRLAPFNSKAIGEPPFMYAIAGYFAILNAIKAFRPKLKAEIRAPWTPERVLLALYS
jgi:xanthine dehydrogenase large subunit